MSSHNAVNAGLSLAWEKDSSRSESQIVGIMRALVVASREIGGLDALEVAEQARASLQRLPRDIERRTLVRKNLEERF